MIKKWKLIRAILQMIWNKESVGIAIIYHPESITAEVHMQNVQPEGAADLLQLTVASIRKELKPSALYKFYPNKINSLN